MKKRNFLYVLVTFLLPIASLTFTSYSGGITGQSTSGCNGANCHGSNSTITNLSVTGIPSSGYVLGSTYNLTFTVSNTNYTMANARGGLNVTCTEGSFAASAGINLSGSSEITHSTAKAMSGGSVSWVVSWTAPTTSSGIATFHFAGNATNGNFNQIGDQPNYDPFPFAQAISTAVPSVSGIGVSAITTSGATISAMINANGSSTTDSLEYGLTTAYGTTVSLNPNPVTGTTATNVNAVLSGLAMNTTYHYRIKAVNGIGTTLSADSSFKTASNVGILDFDKANYVLYPNPTFDAVELKFAENVRVSTLDIFSSTGQIMITPESISQAHSIRVDLSHLATGNYFMYAIVNEKQIKQKITKL